MKEPQYLSEKLSFRREASQPSTRQDGELHFPKVRLEVGGRGFHTLTPSHLMTYPYSICVTVVVLNVHFRSPQTHTMAPWVKRVFIHILPRLLVMRRPHYQIDKRSLASSCHRIMVRTCNGLELRDPGLYAQNPASELLDPTQRDPFPNLERLDDFAPRELAASGLGSACRIHGTPPLPAMLCPDDLPPPPPTEDTTLPPLCRRLTHWHHCPELHKAIDGVRFIADHTKREEDSTKVKEDWKYVAMVLDRLFLWIFTLAVLVGTAGIILQAPTLYDDRIPIDVRLSEIASTTAKPHIATGL
ncbi:extracellular ligand-gated ion channel activity protein [Homalodisca vitripennis]|nr:extracellular ligand-gated ion channel activity protein [Homalodisca vitripennis]